MAQQLESVAVLGTGIMGAPMARNLAAAGLSVRAWNRSRDRADALVDAGVEIAASPADAARGADAVITMLSDGSAVRSVIGGEEPVVEAMEPDAIWVQMSTVGVKPTTELAELAASAGIAFVDAPVLGTKQPAEAGELIVLASGPTDALERCAPIFEAVGSRTELLGEAGQGTRTKLVVNSWVLALTAGLAETITVAETLGVDPRRFLEIINGGPTNAGYAQLKGGMMIEGAFEPSPPAPGAQGRRPRARGVRARGCEPPADRRARAHLRDRRGPRARRQGHGRRLRGGAWSVTSSLGLEAARARRDPRR